MSTSLLNNFYRGINKKKLGRCVYYLVSIIKAGLKLALDLFGAVQRVYKFHTQLTIKDMHVLLLCVIGLNCKSLNY